MTPWNSWELIWLISQVFPDLIKTLIDACNLIKALELFNIFLNLFKTLQYLFSTSLDFLETLPYSPKSSLFQDSLRPVSDLDEMHLLLKTNIHSLYLGFKSSFRHPAPVSYKFFSFLPEMYYLGFCNSRSISNNNCLTGAVNSKHPVFIVSSGNQQFYLIRNLFTDWCATSLYNLV